MRPSWDQDTEKSLSERWQLTRKLWSKASDQAAKDQIETNWHDRIDRLYLNTAMPEATYAKFTRLADNFFIG